LVLVFFGVLENVNTIVFSRLSWRAKYHNKGYILVTHKLKRQTRTMNEIDIEFDFRLDSKCGDPGTDSQKLYEVHKFLWG
jgi:hypothetical protein